MEHEHDFQQIAKLQNGPLEICLDRLQKTMNNRGMVQVFFVWLMSGLIVICPFRCGTVMATSCATCETQPQAPASRCCAPHTENRISSTTDLLPGHNVYAGHTHRLPLNAEPCACGTCICMGAVLSDFRADRHHVLTQYSMWALADKGSVATPQTLSDAVSISTACVAFDHWRVGRGARIAYQSWLI